MSTQGNRLGEAGMNFELSESQRDLRQRACDLATSKIAPRAAEVDSTEQYPWDNVKALTEAGFMGMTVPAQLGGQGLSYLDTTLVIEEMAKVCGISGRIVVEGGRQARYVRTILVTRIAGCRSHIGRRPGRGN